MTKEQRRASLLDRVPPSAIDSEEIILGAIFAQEGVIYQVEKWLKSEDFYKGSHKKIFDLMPEALTVKGVVDVVVLADKLKQKDQLETIGGLAYLAHLMDEVPVDFNLEKHIKIVFLCSVKRKAIDECAGLIDLAFGNDDDLDVFMVKVEEALTRVKEKSISGFREAESMDISLDDLFDEKISFTISTPHRTLNEKIEGYNSSELTIIAGPTGVGKTSFCLGQVIKTAVEEGKGVIYCGAQMDKRRIFLKMIAQMCGVSFRKLFAGRFPADKKAEIYEAHQKVKFSPMKHIILPDRISLPALQTSIMATIRQSEEEINLLIIENLQQLFWPGKDFRNDSFAEANFMIQKIKPWAQTLLPSLVISSQLNRKVSEREDKRPRTTDIFGKDAEELAETILMLYRPAIYEKKSVADQTLVEDDAKLIIGKGGPPVTIPMTFQGDAMIWKEKG